MLDPIRTEQRCGQLLDGLELVTEALVAELPPAEVAHPTERPLDDVAGLTQAAAVLLPRRAVGSQQGANPPWDDRRDDRPDPLRPRALERLGAASRSAFRAGAGRDRLEHLPRQLRVRLVGRPGADHQRNPVRFGHDVTVTALLAAIGGVWAGVRPPVNARTEARSMTARSRLCRPRRPSPRKSRWCRSGQTPHGVQAGKRRPQVLPRPSPRRVGSIGQGMPVLSTTSIPSKQARLGTGGHPPLGDGLGSGSRGALAVQNASETRLGARVPSAMMGRWTRRTSLRFLRTSAAEGFETAF